MGELELGRTGDSTWEIARHGSPCAHVVRVGVDGEERYLWLTVGGLGHGTAYSLDDAVRQAREALYG